jgi:alkylation response protein AidB-like acyl-CoA dehydrogenase
MAVNTEAKSGIVGAPTVAELVQRAAELVPALKERAAHCEELRQIPPETVEDFKKAEFLRIAQPVRFGGLGYDVEAVTEVAMEIGRGCGSSAWMAAQWPGHNFMVGYWPEEAQEEYFGTSGPDTMSSTASAIVKLDVDEKKDGFQVSAHLKFSSGCDYAEWILLNMPPYGECLVPKSDFKVVDDWYVMGLQGTGSKAVVMEDIFIPKHRFISMEALMTGRVVGSEMYPENLYYRVPFHIALNTMLVSAVIGATRGLIEVFDERVLTRKDGHTQQPAFQRPGTQLRFAEATAEVDAAVLVAREIHRGIHEAGRSEDIMDPMERARLRRNVAYATKLCVQAADRLGEGGDASGHYSSSPFQRLARDVHMGALQFVLTWDEPAMAYSQRRWGMETEAFTS